MICVSITGKDTPTALADMKAAAGFCDLMEIRLDYIQSPDLVAILAQKPCPLIATNRVPDEGGRWTGSSEDRVELLSRAAQLGFDFVDVELGWESRLQQRGNARLIVSYHNFEETPTDLPQIHGRLVATGADIVKIVTTANSILDNARMFDLLQNAAVPTIGLCMGELGIISRILAPKFGGFLTFASLADGKESAPGQISAADMRNLYRVHKINRQTAIYGVIANPVAHSMSPAIHNAAFAAAGLNAVYVPLKVERVEEFIREFRRLNVQGYSVTIPHKENAMKAVDEVDAFVRQIGALNTIVNRDGRLYGYNTDWQAAIGAVEKVMPPVVGGSPLRGKRVVLLGAGGTARAIAFGLKHKGAHTHILNRTVERAEQLASEVGCRWGPLENLERLECDVLINTTSIGMHPKVAETPAPAPLLRKGMVVFDAVYNPPVTRLLREAEAAGCLIASGVDMFVGQAAAQFELWTGRSAPADVMREVVLRRLTGKR